MKDEYGNHSAHHPEAEVTGPHHSPGCEEFDGFDYWSVKLDALGNVGRLKTRENAEAIAAAYRKEGVTSNQMFDLWASFTSEE